MPTDFPGVPVWFCDAFTQAFGPGRVVFEQIEEIWRSVMTHGQLEELDSGVRSMLMMPVDHKTFTGPVRT